MLTLEQCRKIDPALCDTPDEELAAALGILYGFGQLAIEDYESKGVPKIPLGFELDSKN